MKLLLAGYVCEHVSGEQSGRFSTKRAASWACFWLGHEWRVREVYEPSALR